MELMLSFCGLLFMLTIQIILFVRKCSLLSTCKQKFIFDWICLVYWIKVALYGWRFFGSAINLCKCQHEIILHVIFIHTAVYKVQLCDALETFFWCTLHTLCFLAPESFLHKKPKFAECYKEKPDVPAQVYYLNIDWWVVRPAVFSPFSYLPTSVLLAQMTWSGFYLKTEVIILLSKLDCLPAQTLPVFCLQRMISRECLMLVPGARGHLSDCSLLTLVECL